MKIAENEQAVELIDTFSLLNDWEDRYRFIIDIGKQLPPIEESEKTEQYRVHGCQSTVFIIPEVEAGPPPRISFRAQSDAAIVNGLIGILHQVYSGRTPQEIVDFPIEDFLRELGLNEHLSPTRRNGLYEMVKRIRTLAEAGGKANGQAS